MLGLTFVDVSVMLVVRITSQYSAGRSHTVCKDCMVKFGKCWPLAHHHFLQSCWATRIHHRLIVIVPLKRGLQSGAFPKLLHPNW